MKISLIASIGKNRELGRNNELLFKISEDMKFFKEKTTGHAIIMGRKTYESIGRPLPNRLNIILSRDAFKNENGIIRNQKTPVLFTNRFEQAIKDAEKYGKDEIFIIGGAQIYDLALPLADKLYLTIVDKEVPDADAFFPDYSEFRTVISERKSSDENHTYTFLEVER